MDTTESSYTSTYVCPGCDQHITVNLGENGWFAACGGNIPGIGCNDPDFSLYDKAMLEGMAIQLVQEPEVIGVNTDEVLAEFFDIVSASLRPYVIALTERLIQEKPHLRPGEALSTTLNWYFN